MSKPYLLKCSLFLSLLLATTAPHLVQADSPTETETTPSVETTAQPPVTAETSEVTPAETTPVAPVATAPAVDPAGTTETVAPTTSAPVITDTTTTASQPVVNTATATPVLPVEGQEVSLRILATTDLHTNLVNHDYYQDKPSQNLGLAKTAVLIKEAKKENGNVVLVDNGDTIQGTPLGTYKAIVDPIEDGEQHPMYKALTALGFDASTLGNHEFNYGLGYLDKLIKSAGMPLVNANVRDADTKALRYQPYAIIPKNFEDKDGKTVTVKIGITGITPPQILNWDKAHLEGKVTVQDAVEAIKEIVPVMKDAGADLVLVLSHSGIGDDKYEKGEENVGYHIAGIPGVDAVVTGHSHAEFPSGKETGFYEKYPGVDGVNGTINGVPVTMGGKYGDHLGVIDLNIVYRDGKWSVANSKASIRKIDTKSDIADQDVINIAKETHEATIAYVNQKVGTTTAPITSYFALVKDDPSIQIVNNAQIWYAKTALAGTPEANLPLLSAAAPFKAGTRGDATAYTDIPAGPMAIKNVADLYLYDNVTALLKVTGAQLKEWLEMSAGQFNQIDPNNKGPQQIINTNYRTYNFDVIDGVSYEIDITQPNKYDSDGNLVNPNASRIVNLSYQGKPVDLTQDFMVVTNNYRASGKFPGVKDASFNQLLGLENRQVIINYIIDQKTINPSADDNWRFADTIKNLDLRFMTSNSDTAKKLIEKSTDIKYLGPSTTTEGFGDYQFIYTEAKPKDDDDDNDKDDRHDKLPQSNERQSQVVRLSKHTLILPAAVSTDDDQHRDSAKNTSSDQRVAKPLLMATSNGRTLPQTGSQNQARTPLFGLAFLTIAGWLGYKKKEESR